MPTKEFLYKTAQSNAPIRWGLLGRARINDKIIPCLKNNPDSKLAAHASRDFEQSRDYAQKWGFEKSYESYEALIAASDVDALYLSLPNSEHFEWTKKALLAGKHLLVEKPLVMTREEFKILKDLAQEKSLFLMEGFMYAFHQQAVKMRELVRDGHLGQIKLVKASFHFVLEDTQNIRLRPDLGGGAMWDIGCYVFHLLASFFPHEKIVDSFSRVEKKYGVDTFTTAWHLLSNGTQLFVDTGFETPRSEGLEVLGTRGVMRVERPFKALEKEKIEIIRGPQLREEIVIEDSQNPYQKEIDFFVGVLKNKEEATELNSLALELMLKSLKL